MFESTKLHPASLFVYGVEKKGESFDRIKVNKREEFLAPISVCCYLHKKREDKLK